MILFLFLCLSATVEVIFKVQDDIKTLFQGNMCVTACDITHFLLRYIMTAWLSSSMTSKKPNPDSHYCFLSYFSSLPMMTHELCTMLQIYAGHILNCSTFPYESQSFCMGTEKKKSQLFISVLIKMLSKTSQVLFYFIILTLSYCILKFLFIHLISSNVKFTYFLDKIK